MLIGIPVYEGVDLLDVTGPYEMFTWAKLDVRLFAERPGLIKCNGGMEIRAPHSFAEAGAFDVLWTPGGAPPALVGIIDDPKHTYLNFLRRQAAGARYVASVCEGALLLAAAGLLDGYTVTTHWAFIPCLLAHYPAVKVADGHPRFWLDRNRLTGGGISSGLDESLELIRLLLGEATAQSVQQTTQYYPDPPVHSEIPQTITCPLDQITVAPQS
jgi:transcriptional regulator GlxA family with amidase domain